MKEKMQSYLIMALMILLATPIAGKSIISEVTGLAVAQATTTWNNIKDAAAGENLTNGVMAILPYFYDGTNFDRATGTTANGIDVDVTRVQGNVTVVQPTQTNLLATVYQPTAANLLMTAHQTVSGSLHMTAWQTNPSGLNVTAWNSNAGRFHVTAWNSTASNLQALVTINSNASPYTLEVAAGSWTSVNGLNKFGRNTDVDTAQEDIWDGGGTWVPPTTARLHNIASTDADDDGSPAGNGAQTMLVIGLNGSYDEVSESITLNGLNNVATTNSYIIITRMYVTAAGSTGYNEGDITATAQTDATVTAQITTGNNQTLMAIWQVPNNKSFYLMRYYASANGLTANHADIKLWVKPFGQTWQLKHILGVDTEGTGFFQYVADPPMKYSAKSLIKISAIAGADNLDVSAGFDGIYK